ncbi:MAG: HAD family hydrolase [Serratia symbiotica]|nr:HAD family hydrolase [Serratia symbiotica]
MAALNVLGVHGVILTGDNLREEELIARELAQDYRSGQLSEDKVRVVTELSRQRATAMIGDGINDALAMKAASIGIAMGSRSDVALETDDAALTPRLATGCGVSAASSTPLTPISGRTSLLRWDEKGYT